MAELITSVPGEEMAEENGLALKNDTVQAFWDYVTKVANGEKLNRMILWQLVENYPQGDYDYNGRAIDNNFKPVSGGSEPEPGSGGEK